MILGRAVWSEPPNLFSARPHELSSLPPHPHRHTAVRTLRPTAGRTAFRRCAGTWRSPGGPAVDAATPTIFVANHTNWWDGFLAFLVARSLGVGFQVLWKRRTSAAIAGSFGSGPCRCGGCRPRAAYADLMAAVGYLPPRCRSVGLPAGRAAPARGAGGALRARRGAARAGLTGSRSASVRWPSAMGSSASSSRGVRSGR